MKPEDYYRYYSNLMTNSVVTFPQKSELIQFVAEMLSSEYLRYLNTKKAATRILDEYVDLEERQKSEPRLVVTYVRSFLNKKLPITEDWWYKFKTKVLRRPQSIVAFDAGQNSELYEFVLKRLKRNDAAANVFLASTRYTIIGDKTLRREVL